MYCKLPDLDEEEKNWITPQKKQNFCRRIVIFEVDG
jgi:hypothetical protein